jgi:hypothetical protein
VYWFALCLLALPCLSIHCFAQTEDVSVAANAAYQQKDWATAAKLYGQLTQAKPKNPRFWYRLGVSRRATGQNEQALHDFQQARNNGLPLSLIGFDIACAYSSLGQKDKTFETLAEAIQQGFAQPERMSNDPSMQSLQSDPRFAALLEKATRNQNPCAHNAENRQFDFWVGEWDVVDASLGITAGSSRIEKALGECVIWEKASALSGRTGLRPTPTMPAKATTFTILPSSAGNNSGWTTGGKPHDTIIRRLLPCCFDFHRGVRLEHVAGSALDLRLIDRKRGGFRVNNSRPRLAGVGCHFRRGLAEQIPRRRRHN